MQAPITRDPPTRRLSWDGIPHSRNSSLDLSKSATTGMAATAGFNRSRANSEVGGRSRSNSTASATSRSRAGSISTSGQLPDMSGTCGHTGHRRRISGEGTNARSSMDMSSSNHGTTCMTCINRTNKFESNELSKSLRATGGARLTRRRSSFDGCCTHNLFEQTSNNDIIDANLFATATSTQMATTMSVPRHCRHHPSKDLDLYCRVHKEAVCNECTRGQHKSCPSIFNHVVMTRTTTPPPPETRERNPSPPPAPLANNDSVFQPIEEAAKELSEQLLVSLAQPIHIRESKLLTAIVGLVSVREDIRRQVDNFVKLLDDDRDRMVLEATARSEVHKDALRELARRKDEALRVQEEALAAQVDILAKDRLDIMETVSTLDMTGKPLEVIQTCLKLMDKARGDYSADLNTEPVERANLRLKLPSPDAVLEEIRNRGWVGEATAGADPDRCILSGPAVVSMTTCKLCTFVLETRDQNGKALVLTESVVSAKARLATKGKVIGGDLPLGLESKGEGKYEISLGITEEMAGQEVEVVVTVDGQPVKSSPKRVVVLKEPVRSVILAELGQAAGLQTILALMPDKTFNLLYRASRDGWSAKEFHSRCDQKGPTLTLLKTQDGKAVFGGYTSVSWESPVVPSFKADKDAFLFSLISKAGARAEAGAVRMTIKEGKEDKAIYCSRLHGPMFGGGRDLCVLENGRSQMSASNSKLGTTYELPTSPDAETYLAGSQAFLLSELEVFQLL